MLGAMAAVLYFVSQQFLMYLRYPTATKVTIQEENPIDFPAVTICNMNQFLKSVVTSDPNLERVARSLFPLTGGTVGFNFSDPKVIAELNQYNVQDISKKASPPFDEMFYMCNWRSQNINCHDYFTEVRTHMGFCYTFNSAAFIRTNGTLRVYRTGSAQSLFLRLNVMQDEYFFGESTSAGFKVRLKTCLKSCPCLKMWSAAVI